MNQSTVVGKYFQSLLLCCVSQSSIIDLSVYIVFLSVCSCVFMCIRLCASVCL